MLYNVGYDIINCVLCVIVVHEKYFVSVSSILLQESILRVIFHYSARIHCVIHNRKNLLRSEAVLLTYLDITEYTMYYMFLLLKLAKENICTLYMNCYDCIVAERCI